MSTSKLQNKLYDLRKKKPTKAKNTVSMVFVAMATKETHVTCWKDIHNKCKYHFLRIAWSKDINFLM